MVNGEQFDLSQIADVVNRNKISDKRKRNEMMRLGTSDPNSFAMQNQQQIQEAQQPTEFWGAGRKEASNQNPDLAAANMVGGLYNLGGVYNYYGDKDTSTAQFGTKGYQTKDLGGGKFDILGQDGSSLGQGFGSVADAINAYRKQAYVKGIQTNVTDMFDFSKGGRIQNTSYTIPGVYDPNSPQTIDAETGAMSGQSLLNYSSYEDAVKAAEGLVTPYQSRPTGFGALEDWEILGQLLNKKDGLQIGYNPMENYFGDSRRFIPGNKQSETISGLNTLFGSTPLIWDNKVQGYSFDPTPADKSIVGYENPYSVGRYDTSGRTQSAAQLSRRYNNPEQWQQLGTSLNENQFYVPAENASKLPGWTQTEFSDYNKSSNSLFGNVFRVLDPILDKIDPLHNPSQDFVTKILGKDNQQQAFETVAPIVASFFGGWGSLANAANSASVGDMTGAALGALGGAMSLSGAGTPTSYLRDVYKNMGASPALATAGANFTTSALTNVARGGDLKSALGSALFGAAGGAAGDALAKATQGSLGDMGSKMLGGAASGGISSLFSKNSPIAGSLYGAMSGGLHGFLNSTSKTGNQFNQKKDQENQAKAQALAKLFKSSIYKKVK